MKKRFVCVLLCLVVLFVMTVPVFAAESYVNGYRVTANIPSNTSSSHGVYGNAGSYPTANASISYTRNGINYPNYGVPGTSYSSYYLAYGSAAGGHIYRAVTIFQGRIIEEVN